MLLKPRNGTACRDIYPVADAAELARVLKEIEHPAQMILEERMEDLPPSESAVCGSGQHRDHREPGNLQSSGGHRVVPDDAALPLLGRLLPRRRASLRHPGVVRLAGGGHSGHGIGRRLLPDGDQAHPSGTQDHRDQRPSDRPDTRPQSSSRRGCRCCNWACDSLSESMWSWRGRSPASGSPTASTASRRFRRRRSSAISGLNQLGELAWGPPDRRPQRSRRPGRLAERLLGQGLPSHRNGCGLRRTRRALRSVRGGLLRHL